MCFPSTEDELLTLFTFRRVQAFSSSLTMRTCSGSISHRVQPWRAMLLPSESDELGAKPISMAIARDYLAVFDTEEGRNLQTDMTLLSRVDCVGIIATAPDSGCDFVSRFFAPRVGVDEAPVCGSTHCTLIPYWSQQLKRTRRRALQISSRAANYFVSIEEGEAALVDTPARTPLGFFTSTERHREHEKNA